ncbi:hypothetical protein [Vibrio parahaemolyticus]|uniref:hypothetical protein n=1 Tax=Vibrio parahaemolyticus TaxID=670 RepID=UPI000C99A284|nr:hypothetical protein [Vibrio parahaemolyticus]PMS91972.1 hypothetical protein C1T06_23050 [Vibrio parahaemolyticus]
MKITPLQLPSNPKIKVHFRTPTVDDAISIAELDPAFEESIANDYLTDIQDKDKNKGRECFDPREWTIEDRKLALMWIFVQSREDHKVPISYHCNHCDEKHYIDVDVSSILETGTAMNCAPVQAIEFQAGNKTLKARVSPLNGAHAEALELLRMERDSYDEGTKEYRQCDVSIVMAEHAYLLSIEGEPEDPDEAFTYKMNFLRSLPLDSEFRALVAKVEQALRKMRHGVPVRYLRGRYLLICNHPNCSKAIEKGESDSKELLLPFRINHFLPKL